MDENADGGVVAAVATENANEVTVDDDRFEVAGGNLKLKAGTMLDFESDASPIDVTITASGDGDSATHTVSVSINDVNEMPSIEVMDGATPDGMTASSTVEENDAGAILGAIHLSDPDGGQTHTLTVTGDDRVTTKQDAEGGWWLALADGESFDFEADGDSITVTVMVADDGDPAMSAETEVTITITDVNEAPYAPGVASDSVNIDENAEGATISAVDAGMDPEGDDLTYHVDDERFEITDARVLKLKDDMSLDHEMEGYVMLEVTVMDSHGQSSPATMVTVNVNDLNEPPTVDGELPDVTGVAGTDLEIPAIDLHDLFSDQDDTDSLFTYELEDGPDGWNMTLTTEAVKHEEGTSITGTITGKPPTGALGEFTVAVVATDDEGASSRAEFDIVVDDGNDQPTEITLTGTDGSDTNLQVTLDENVAGVILGSLSVDDIDSENHPHGQHKWTVDHAMFEISDSGQLKLKDDMSLDYEMTPAINVMVTATDMNGDKSGLSFTRAVHVTVTNKNDAPKAIEAIGNWWVTIDEDLDSDDALKGEWLTFSLETVGDENPAFTDDDVDDMLKFSITSGPDWLEIGEDSGEFTNKAGTKAAPGKYNVTVRATDQGEEYAEVTFMIVVAESGPNDEDNDEPEVNVELINNGDYTEGSGKVAVATVTVTDDDFSLSPHPYGKLAGDKPLLANDDADGDGSTDGTGHAAQFELSKDYSQNGNARTWTVYVKDKNSFDHEVEDDINITVMAYNDLNGNGEMDDDEGDSETISIDVEDANEAPKFTYPGESMHSGASGDPNAGAAVLTKTGTGATIKQKQKEDAKTTLYLNLFELWDDQDDDDDDDDLMFDVSTLTPWIKVLHVGQWEDISAGPDGDDDEAADNVAWEEGLTTPDDDDWIAIIEIDRMTNNGQTGDGAITLTARDEGGMTGSATILVDITDQNLPIPYTVDTDDDGQDDAIGGTVEINGVLREGNSLTMSFDHSQDPDFADGSSPVLVRYTWSTRNEVEEGGEGAWEVESESYGSPETLMLTQDHVGKEVRASVMYHELLPQTGDISSWMDGGSYTVGPVTNVRDAGAAHIVFTTSGTMLKAEVRLVDEDGIAMEDTDKAPDYTWEQSDNGVGGWTAVASDADTTDMLVDLGAAGGEGKHYRLVITYEDNYEANERVVSDTIQVGKLEDPNTAPTVTGSLAVGGKLTVAASGGSVQWQRKMDSMSSGEGEDGEEYWVDIADNGDGSLTLTNTHAGQTLRALVTYKTGDDITAIVAATHGTGDAATMSLEIADMTPNVAPVSLGDYDIEATVEKQKGPLSVITTVEDTVDIASLFQDADGDELTFSFDLEITQDFLHIDLDTGKLLYMTDNQGRHDGDDTDGGGNVLDIDIVATDPDGEEAVSTVSIRLNVPPKEIASGSDPRVSIAETTSSTAKVLVSDLNVQDENDPTHLFGQYTWEVSDDRFKVTPDKTDTSMATLSVLAGKAFEAVGGDQTIKVKVTATEKASGEKVEFTLTVTVTNDLADPAAPATPDPVPGLKDNDGDMDDTGEGDDTDTDGGLPPPPDPSMMIDEDLLDDFVIAIDDIDIA